MEPIQTNKGFDTLFVRNMVEAALRIGLVFLLLLLTFEIIRPFLIPLAWGGIIAIAAFPLTRRLEGWLGGRRKLAATLVTLFLILILVIPCYELTEALVSAARSVSQRLSSGEIQVPGPSEKVAGWPVVGEKLYAAWSLAHTNLQEAVVQAAPRLKSAAAAAASTLGAGLVSVMMFVVSLLIAGGFMAYADTSATAANRLFVRLGGLNPGGEWAQMCVATVRSVLQGVVGIAVIQAALCAIGLFAMGIPGAPIWSALILLLAIAQLPTIIVVAPILFYAFNHYDTTPAVVFTVWMLMAGLSDTFLKPLLMGRGLDIPMPIILMGAIGGMLAAGIIGLFAGAVVLAIWYKLFKSWLEQAPIADA
ncbi:MAG: AI-2E family transporter [Gammaproteobacteria bacterium]|jgi:predicted PurR-regulated permease PerM|nr:AI-2E family transporter [Gammaproteobacteria bacterium]MDH5172424.1 AI-2E family transporter [Gammaproteobacteria bacterium]